jgi:hypothetical protein
VNALTPVSFKKGREFKPRLSPPREPGRTSERYFSEYEKCVIRSHYPDGGAAGCMARLEGRSQAQIQRQAHALGVRFKGVGERRVFARPDDETIRARWAELNGRGAVQRLADELGVPRHWLSARAIRLGLTTPHKKEPPWSEAEDALMRRAPLHDPRRAARLCRRIWRDGDVPRRQAPRRPPARRRRAQRISRAAHMSVYVDDARHPFRGMIMCHMWADSLDELLAMADRLPLDRRWLQKPPKASWTHFDVSLAMKTKALRLGAALTDKYGPVEHVARLNVASGDPALVAYGEKKLADVARVRSLPAAPSFPAKEASHD